MKLIIYSVEPIKDDWLATRYAVVKVTNDLGKEEKEYIHILETKEAAITFANELSRLMGLPTILVPVKKEESKSESATSDLSMINEDLGDVDPRLIDIHHKFYISS